MVNTPARRRAAIYVRISGQSDDKRYSLDTQAEACLAKAHELGYDAGKGDIFEDQWTGFELGRPQLARLRESIRKGEYQAVVFYALDRLARNQAHVYILLDECERNGVALEGVTDTIDTSSLGKLVLSIKAFVAEVEREKIRDRCNRGKARKMAEGKILGSGTPRFGYKIDENGRYVRDEGTAPVVERIFEAMGVRGLSARSVARELAEGNVPPPGRRRKNARGKHWTTSSIGKIVKDEVYIGVFYWGKTTTNGKRVNGRLVQTPAPRDQWRRLPDGAVVPFIDEDVWRAANARLASRSGDQARNVKIPRLLRGLIFCKVCGSKMTSISVTGPSNGKRHGYYACPNHRRECRGRFTVGGEPGKCPGRSIPCDYAHEAVWERVVALKDNPEEFRRRYEAAVARAGESPLRADLEAVEREAEKKERLVGTLREKWAEALAEGDGDFAAVAEGQLRATMASARKLRQSAVEIEAEVARMDSVADAYQKIEARVRDAAALLREATFEQRRDLLEALDVRVDADGKDFRLTITPFAEPELCSSATLQNCKRSRIDLSADCPTGHPSEAGRDGLPPTIGRAAKFSGLERTFLDSET